MGESRKVRAEAAQIVQSGGLGKVFHVYTWYVDDRWPGIELKGQILYELHLGCFTPEGTFAAAERQLPELKRLGITTIELMPLNECPGRWNWGYDGVALFAPAHVYGRPLVAAEAFTSSLPHWYHAE